MSNLEALTTDELIVAYEAVRDQRTAERTRIQNALGWRVHTESPAPRGAGLHLGGVTYTLDSNDELVRHAGVYRRTYTKSHEKTPKTCRVTL